MHVVQLIVDREANLRRQMLRNKQEEMANDMLEYPELWTPGDLPEDPLTMTIEDINNFRTDWAHRSECRAREDTEPLRLREVA